MNLFLLGDAASVHTYRWATFLRDAGHRVDLLSLRRAQIDGVRVHHLRAFLPGKIGYLTVTGEVRRLIARIRPDIVHAHYATSYGLLGALSGFHPFVVSVWGSDVFDFPRQSLLHRKILEYTLAQADHVCSTSKIMAEEVQRYCMRRVTVTPFGIDCQVFRPADVRSQGAGVTVVGTVRSLERKYGIEYLIRSFSAASTRYGPQRKLRLVIAGEGSLKGRLRDLARECGVSDDTDFVGNVPHQKVPELMNSFSVFVAVSIADSESFGVAVLEASACGVPVIVSRIGGLPEVVRDGITGLIVPPRDIGATVIAICRLIEDEELRTRMGAAGREFVMAEYEWSENAARMDRLYHAILNQP